MNKRKRLGVIVAAAGIFLLTPVTAFGAEKWENQNGARYRVKEDGTRYTNEWFSVTNNPSQPSGTPSASWYYAGADGKIYTNGWYDIDGKIYYFYAGGNAAVNSNFVLDGKRFYVDEDGAKRENGWFVVEGTYSNGTPYSNWYYQQTDSSLLADGWHEVDGVTMYFDVSGRNYRKQWINQEDKRYYVDENGALQTGWFAIRGTNTNGQEYANWYYADSNGVIARNGWSMIDGKWYYFDANGLNYRKRWYVDSQKERYYLDEEGVLEDKGWFKIENVNTKTQVVTESWYYARESGALLKGGYHEVDGKIYYFDANGYNYRKRWMTLPDGGRRYLGEDGVMKQCEWFVISGLDSRDSDYNYWYYAMDNGNIVMDRWYKINGKNYGFNSSGVMRTGWLTDNKLDDDGDSDDSYYYCGEDGAKVTGWQWLEIPDNWGDDSSDVTDYVHDNGQYAWFYFNQSTGKKRRSSGGKKEINVDGVTYCFDGNGIMYPGWVKLSSKTSDISGYRYFYQPTSETDKTFIAGQKVEGSWLYINGPADLDGNGQKEWYYFDNSGEPVHALEDKYKRKEIHGDMYVFDMYGEAQYGLVEISGVSSSEDGFYYCGGADENRKCVTGKVMIDDGVSAGKSQYYFDNDGRGITGTKDGYLYYNGKLQKADKAAKYEVFQLEEGGRKYLVSSSGKVMKNTKVTDGNDQKWEVGGGGTIEVYGSSEIAELTVPEATTTY